MGDDDAKSAAAGNGKDGSNNKDNDKDKDRDKDAKPPELPPPPHHEDRVSETTHSATIGDKRVGYTVRAGHTLAHLGLEPELAGNITMAYYEGGYMMYVHQDELSRLADDMHTFVSDTLATAAATGL